MTITPIATFHSPITTKFGVPRQSGIVESLRGEIVFLPEYRNPDFIAKIESLRDFQDEFNCSDWIKKAILRRDKLFFKFFFRLRK